MRIRSSDEAPPIDRNSQIETVKQPVFWEVSFPVRKYVGSAQKGRD